MNTNNRNVRLQYHVVLLTVMEQAEDLIKKYSWVLMMMIKMKKKKKMMMMIQVVTANRPGSCKVDV